MIVAMLALFVALTGTAVATSSALIGSAQIRNNSITGLDVKNRSLRPIDFRGSVRGPRGLRGLTGATGAPGAPGAKGDKGDKGDTGAAGQNATKLWALINTAGVVDPVVTRSSGAVIAAERLDVGYYRVRFNQDVNGCIGMVSLTNAAVGPLDVPGEIAVNDSASFADGLLIRTRDSAGVLQDNKDFTIAVFC
jgi:hypothetical protein